MEEAAHFSPLLNGKSENHPEKSSHPLHSIPIQREEEEELKD